MNYQGNIIRPPSEADSIILQVTVGCSHNRCSFCGAYRGELFRIKDLMVIHEDLDFAARHCRNLKRVFLADGDAMIIPRQRLASLLATIRQKLPWIRRISLYANAGSILAKSVAELRDLKSLGLDRVYMGLETGHDPTLAAIRKGADSRTMLEAGARIREAGLFLSVTVLLGIAGAGKSSAHAKATAAVLNQMAPNQIAVLTLMLLENTELYQEAVCGRFQMPSAGQLLTEVKTMVEHIILDRVMFHANHASNYLPVKARLARDKEDLLLRIQSALDGEIELQSDERRGL
jgi:radical SAM superfamily enzyme YgiQ (UPF0313 family)